MSFKNKNNKAESIAKRAMLNSKLLAELINGFLSDRADIKFKSAKVLVLISKNKPKMLYPYFNFFAEQLDNQNNILKRNAIEIITNLATVDADNKFEAIVTKLFSMLYKGNMITAVHVVAGAPTIIKAKPYLEEQFTRQILKATNAPLPTEECRNILKGYQITAFEQYFDQTKSEFEFTNVVQGYYYLLAWKDLNGSGMVDNNDIVGVHGGTYTPGYGGTQVTVTDGNMTDVGDIVMLIYKELLLTVSGVRDNNGWLDFTYSFNDNCYVSSWTLTIPGGQSASDPTQVGNKTANTQYHSDDWAYSGGAPLPSGNYIVTITGTWNSTNFTFSDPMYIAK